MLGYLIEQEISNALPDREVAAIVTRVEVDPRDPAFGSPTKPIGPVYDDEEELQRIAKERRWSVAADGAGDAADMSALNEAYRVLRPGGRVWQQEQADEDGDPAHAPAGQGATGVRRRAGPGFVAVTGLGLLAASSALLASSSSRSTAWSVMPSRR